MSTLDMSGVIPISHCSKKEILHNRPKMRDARHMLYFRGMRSVGPRRESCPCGPPRPANSKTRGLRPQVPEHWDAQWERECGARSRNFGVKRCSCEQAHYRGDILAPSGVRSRDRESTASLLAEYERLNTRDASWRSTIPRRDCSFAEPPITHFH
jgi:hypothetical protein